MFPLGFFMLDRYLLLLTVITICHESIMASDKNSATNVVFQSTPLVIAHRGDSATHPENTLPAFESALDTGADLIELDYYHSRDGIPFVFHDRNLDRTSNANVLLRRKDIPTSSLSLAELKKLDAGLWKDPRFKGTRIPTLNESLDLIQQGSITLIERKHGDAATIVALLDQKKLLSNVVVQAFDWEYLSECHQLKPDLLLGALGSKEFRTEDLQAIERSGARIVGWSYKDVTASMVEQVHGKSWKLWVYTVNDPNEALRLIRLGVDGIITDQPLRIGKALNPAKK